MCSVYTAALRRGFALHCHVCLSVCLSVRYTSGASFRPENAVTYSAGNEGQKICGVFSETAPLQRSSIPSNDGNTYRRPFFVRKARMRIIAFTTWWTGAEQPFLPVCWCREGGLFLPMNAILPRLPSQSELIHKQ